jgi:hypothetical protein
VAGSFVPVLCLAAIAVAIAAFYLATYVRHRFAVPLGWDSPGYAWRTNLARTVGIGNLPATVPYPGPVNPGRPGFVAVGGIVAALSGQDALRVTAALPAVMAAATGLAWTAVARAALGWSFGRSAFLGAFVATSPFMVHVIGVEQYQDATIALAVASAATVPLVLTGRDGRALWAAAALFAAAGTIHWSFLPILLATLGLTALAYLPASIRRRPRSVAAVLRTPSARLVTVGALAAAGAVVAIVLLMPAPLPRAQLVAAQLLDKLHRDLPQLALWLLLPLSAVGAIVLAERRSAGPNAHDVVEEDAAAPRPLFLWFALAWCEVTLLAVAAVWLFAVSVPAHRILAFCLPVPALAAVGLLWLADRGARSGEMDRTGRRAARSGRALGAAIAILGLAVSAFVAQRAWLSYHPVMRASTYTQAQAAAAAVDRAGLPVDRPLVFVLDDRGQYAWSRTWIAAQTIRAALPPERVTHAFFFVGRPEDLLARRPSSLPSIGMPANSIDPVTYRSLSETYFDAVRPILARNPAVFVLSSANPEFAEWVRSHPNSQLATGVASVDPTGIRGLSATVQGRTESAPLTPIGVVGVAILALVVISFVGAGWSVTLVGRWLDLTGGVALAPAVGTAALVLGAILFGRLGVRLTPAGSILIVAMVALLGWAGPLIARLLSNRTHAESVTPG